MNDHILRHWSQYGKRYLRRVSQIGYMVAVIMLLLYIAVQFLG